MVTLYQKMTDILGYLSTFVTNIMRVMFEPLGEFMSVPNVTPFWAGVFAPFKAFLNSIGWEELTLLHLMFVVGVNIWLIRFLSKIFSGD